MAVVASATGVALGMTAGTIGAGLVGGAVLGAGAGALYSGITGDGNILNSALTGALIGGGVGGLGAAFAPAGATSAAGIGGGGAFVPAAGSGASFVAPTAAQVAGAANTPAMAAAALNAPTGAMTSTGSALANASADPIMAAANMSGMSEGQIAAMNVPAGASPVPTAGLSNKELLGYGLAGTAALSLLGSQNQSKLPDAPVDPGQIRPYTYSTKTNQAAFPTGPLYGADGLPIAPKPEQSYFTQSYTAGTPYAAANGGLMSIGGPVERRSQNVMGGLGNMYPQSQQVNTNFSVPSQMPTSAEIIRSDYDVKTDPYRGVMMAGGGITYDDKTQKYSGLPQMGPAQAADVQILDSRPAPVAQPAQQANPFGSLGMFGLFGREFGFGNDNGAPVDQGPEPYTPATALYRDDIDSLTSQWQAANPYVKTYDPTVQKYGAGKPTNAQLLAFQNAQAEKAYQDRLNAYEAERMQSYGSNDFAGGANGGLMNSYAMGGNVEQYNLGGYSDGGRLLKGPGDGVSDDIPAVIGDKQPARLADGEFVIPARIVSELGNGSTDAGAKRLYAMMDKIQAGRKKTIGKNNVAKDTKAKKHLLA